MTKLTYTQEESSQAHLPSDTGEISSAAEQILHLKRLLVTLKQQYEKGMQDLQEKLQAEQDQKMALKQEIERLNLQGKELKDHYEDELKALRDQQIALRDLLKKTQDELKQQREAASAPVQPEPELIANRQRMEQLERVIPYLRERTEEAHLETEQLRQELERAQKKSKELEAELAREKQQAQKDIEQLQQLLASQQEKNPEIIASHTSSYQLRQELEVIKRTLVQGSQETKELESRYVEALREKVNLEHEVKQLQIQLDHQSSNLSAFQENIQELEQMRKSLEATLLEKEGLLAQSEKKREELHEQLQHLETALQERLAVQENYEQLKEEWSQLSFKLEEALEARVRAEQQLEQLEAVIKEQDCHLAEKGEHIFQLSQEKDIVEADIHQLRLQLEESETRLKVAQQHLAKKVKEAAMLMEKCEEQQASFNESLQAVEGFKAQIGQLQASIDNYQKQEKRLQEQLHDALKGTEIQVTKWEEKYFRMYDKWQESENRVRELRKIEEKHHQMQSLLANLGTFMGTSFPASSGLFHSRQEAATEKTAPSRSSLFEMVQEANPSTPSKSEPSDEKYDLFGMRQPQDKFKPNLFS
ncbi:hypothetical protein [Candidatus Protochlamydia phocaeensis]|uniref:hypothetical protein n=1 Tax=Candidatus Protochlamydia phocaeensis TaxID=1414722 RepID=UPI000837E097|nr:hypothetical protein [Candidatus Protochlamydia phocaeensis]